MWTRLQQRRTVVRDALRSRLWPVPALAVVTALAAGVAVPELDRLVDGRLPATVEAYLFGGGADAAREILGTIASALMTVTSLTFSLTLVTLQLASSQYTPRLLRTFASDHFVQRTLALFLATFAYAVTVLRTVRNDSDTITRFVPKIAVTGAFLLAVASVMMLVLFLGHLVRQIRIETMLDHIRTDAVGSAGRLLESRDDAGSPGPPPAVHPSATAVPARTSGFLVGIDEDALCSAACSADALIWVDQPLGAAVVRGVPVAFFRMTDGDDAAAAESLCDAVAAALHTDIERTGAQDIAYGLRQVVDVVLRALSPGINDPTTAIHGLHACSAMLCEFIAYRLGPHVMYDDDDVARVVIARPSLADLLDTVCNQTVLYGGEDSAVTGEILVLLRQVGWMARSPDDRGAVGEQLARVERDIGARAFDPIDRARLARLGSDVRAALDHRWPTG
ncbi:DUF2254 domain-containing protein [Mycobacterium sp. PSTR-4-N]|uniref:DUF2254 domain-containing protein n=1 Tax=Mycobacterium sp. PSTR-4-N TaxID=2917745 RepID=UPI001F14B5C3|nr:DUF2254 domain-containing protein [Mycobacterium sp. PSTR-4-N]MCG7593674.1 DUF2254 domain-containing protein [Mycobacterium sp. PSTR-4-N]